MARISDFVLLEKGPYILGGRANQQLASLVKLNEYGIGKG